MTTHDHAPELCAVDLMTSNLLTVTPDESVLMAWELMRRARVHHVPVVEEDWCVGLLDERQLAVQCAFTPLGEHRRQVRDLLDGPVERVTTDTPVSEVARRLLDSRHDAVVVTDDEGALVGLVTVHDLVRVLTGTVTPVRGQPHWRQAPTLFRLTPVLPAHVPDPSAERTAG